VNIAPGYVGTLVRNVWMFQADDHVPCTIKSTANFCQRGYISGRVFTVALNDETGTVTKSEQCLQHCK
jgi:hypothetical protein